MSRKARIGKIEQLFQWVDPEVEHRRNEQAIEARRRMIAEMRAESGYQPTPDMERMMEQVVEMAARVREATNNFGKDVKRLF